MRRIFRLCYVTVQGDSVSLVPPRHTFWWTYYQLTPMSCQGQQLGHHSNKLILMIFSQIRLKTRFCLLWWTQVILLSLVTSEGFEDKSHVWRLVQQRWMWGGCVDPSFRPHSPVWERLESHNMAKIARLSSGNYWGRSTVSWFCVFQSWRKGHFTLFFSLDKHLICPLKLNQEIYRPTT